MRMCIHLGRRLCMSVSLYHVHTYSYIHVHVFTMYTRHHMYNNTVKTQRRLMGLKGERKGVCMGFCQGLSRVLSGGITGGFQSVLQSLCKEIRVVHRAAGIAHRMICTPFIIHHMSRIAYHVDARCWEAVEATRQTRTVRSWEAEKRWLSTANCGG